MAQRSRPRFLTRRRFLQQLAGLGLMTAGAATYVRVLEPRWLAVEELELPLPGLPSALDGRRIAQISDIHLSEYFSPDQLADALSHLRQLAPDWLVLTGDFVGGQAGSAAGLVEPLAALDMPVYASLGNHDHWTHWPTVKRHLEAGGATVLHNQAVQVAPALWFAGVDDIWSGRPDLGAALWDVPRGATTVLLAHEPDYFDTVLRVDAPVKLQLSGHSHGGQVRLPRFEPNEEGFSTWAPILPYLGRRYPIGLRQVGARSVYTNRGLGVWPLPYRFNCRPELTTLTLRSA